MDGADRQQEQMVRQHAKDRAEAQAFRQSVPYDEKVNGPPTPPAQASDRPWSSVSA
jgi:hypothetical protein